MKFFFKFKNKTLPKYFRSLFTFNHEMYQIETRNRDNLHFFSTRTGGAQNVLRHHIPTLLLKFPRQINDMVLTYSILTHSIHTYIFIFQTEI